MISLCFAVIVLFSLFYAALTGNLPAMTSAVIDGCAKSVKISLELCGTACFWCGVMQVYLDSGILDKLSRIMSPILGKIFPTAWKTKQGMSEITAAICANLLGIGNAATPYALSAMAKMDESSNTADMASFTVLGTCSVSLVPTTILTLRRAAGSAEPYSVIAPIWICSFMCALVGIILSRAAAYVRLKKAKPADSQAEIPSGINERNPAADSIIIRKKR